MPRVFSEPVPPDGFTDFVTAHSSGLLRSAWLLTGDHGKAEDLLQTVLASGEAPRSAGDSRAGGCGASHGAGRDPRP